MCNKKEFKETFTFRTMLGVIGIDSRMFRRNTTKKDGSPGEFISVVGMGVRVKDYEKFDQEYEKAMENAFKINGLTKKYKYYCLNDFEGESLRDKIVESFVGNIKNHIEKVHVFYALFSEERIERIKVYGRYSKRKGIKLSKPDRTQKQLIKEHLVNTFPGICAWRLMEFFSSPGLQFHIDFYEGHISEAQEEFENSSFAKLVFPSGDCVNPVISTADILLGLFDKRLSEKKLYLLFQNVRKALPEFKEKILAYPILNKHLPKITPLDKIPIDNNKYMIRPIYWVFKGDNIINSRDLKHSETYRNLLDFVSFKGGCVKIFDNSKDSSMMNQEDFGVYLNNMGKEQIKTYNKLGKKIRPFNLDLMVPDDYKNL